MSVRVPISLLTDEVKGVIRKELTIKVKGFVQPTRFNEKLVRFFISDGEFVYLPMRYGADLLGFSNWSRLYPKVSPFEMKAPLRDYQEEIVELAIDSFNKTGGVFLNLFCSYGKTFVGAFFAALFSQQRGLVSLVTYPRRVIGDSWLGTFREKTTAKVYVIGETKGPPDDDVQVFLCMNTRLKELDDNIRSRIGHFVLDEADCFCTGGNVEGLLTIEPMFLTVLTATYERDDGLHTMIDLLVGEEKITRISKKPFSVFKLETGIQVEPKMGPKGVLFGSIVEKLDVDEKRNEIIVSLVEKNPREKILIITKHKEHVRTLFSLLKERLPEERTVALFMGSDRGYDDSDVLITTYSKAGRGFDEESGCRNWNRRRINMGILASSTKKIEQPAGRFLRCDSPIIFDIVDDQKNLHHHWNLRRRWYESRNGKVRKVQGAVSIDDVPEQLYVENELTTTMIPFFLRG